MFWLKYQPSKFPSYLTLTKFDYYQTWFFYSLCLMMRVSLRTLPNVQIRDPSHDKNLPTMKIIFNIFYIFHFLFSSRWCWLVIVELEKRVFLSVSKMAHFSVEASYQLLESILEYSQIIHKLLSFLLIFTMMEHFSFVFIKLFRIHQSTIILSKTGE